MGTEHPRHPDDLAGLDDRELVSLAQGLAIGTAAELETARRCVAAVALRHRQLVRTIIGAKVPRSAIDDVESDVWAGFAAKVWSGAPIGNPAGLLVRLATFRRADFLEGRARRDGELSLEEWDRPAEDPSLEEAAVEQTVEQLLSCLTDRQREIVWERVVAGRPSLEVAAMYGTTPGNVDVIVHRALAKMREAMQ